MPWKSVKGERGAQHLQRRGRRGFAGEAGPFPEQDLLQRPSTPQPCMSAGEPGDRLPPPRLSLRQHCHLVLTGTHSLTLTHGTLQQRSSNPPAAHTRPCPDGPIYPRPFPKARVSPAIPRLFCLPGATTCSCSSVAALRRS